MSETLFDTLSTEVNLLIDSGEAELNLLRTESDNFLEYLKDVEQSLIKEVELEADSGANELKQVESLSKSWYNGSISHLKSYNSSINRCYKSVLSNSKFNIDLDDAYSYPLRLDNFPVSVSQAIEERVKGSKNTDFESQMVSTRIRNREFLLKSIILHLLKMGQCDIVQEFVKELPSDPEVKIDESLLKKFETLKIIVDNIVLKHDLTQALEWFKNKYNDSISLSSNLSGPSNSYHSSYSEIEFKFHMLQFILLLNGDGSDFCIENSLKAYLYSKENFTRFFKDYVHELSPLMTLLIFETDKNLYDERSDNFSNKNVKALVRDFIEKSKHSYGLEHSNKSNNRGESKFVYELLNSFEQIHDNQALFVNLSNEFISEYCKDLKLSNDSSLFQSLLAGLIYLPSFYKYKKIQMKMNKVLEDKPTNVDPGFQENLGAAPYDFDLPFQLPDSNRFLFNYHPIFICPVSKDQLVPGLQYYGNQSSLNPSSGPQVSPVVVLNFCNHVVLRESIWQLSKKGTEIFKCHYCYKKHEYSNVSDAYFIDL